MARDNSYGPNFPVDPISRQPIGQNAPFALDDLDKFNPVSAQNPFPTTNVGQSLDANGFQRISEATTLFNNVNSLDRNETLWIEDTSGGTETITHDFNHAACALNIGTASGEYCLRQSFLRPAYDAGKPNRGQYTHVLPPYKVNQGVEIGFGDDSNGILMVRDPATGRLGCLLRSSANALGTPNDDNIVWQEDWNGGKAGGSLNQGLIPDLTQRNLLRIDYLWQGVGPVRFAFVRNGIPTTMHTFFNSNTGTYPYTRTASLPARYKIYNVGVVASPSTLYEICTDIVSEGGHTPAGIKWSVENDLKARRAVTGTVAAPDLILAIRHKPTFNGHPNFGTFSLLDAGLSTSANNASARLVHFHGVTADTATWQDVDTGSSGLEFSRNVSSITAAHAHIFDHQLTTTVQGGKAASEALNARSFDGHATISQNLDASVSEIFGIMAYSETGTADMWSHITGREFR